MNRSIYQELQAAAERVCVSKDGPAWQTLSQAQDEFDALLPRVLHRSFRRVCDQAVAAAAEHGEDCFLLGLRCGLLLMADARALDRA